MAAGKAEINATEQKKPTYEEALAELEAAVNRLEREEIPLEESIALFTRGVELAGVCNEILDAMEARIQKLVEKPDGEIVEERFE